MNYSCTECQFVFDENGELISALPCPAHDDALDDGPNGMQL